MMLLHSKIIRTIIIIMLTEYCIIIIDYNLYLIMYTCTFVVTG